MAAGWADWEPERKRHVAMELGITLLTQVRARAGARCTVGSQGSGVRGDPFGAEASREVNGSGFHNLRHDGGKA